MNTHQHSTKYSGFCHGLLAVRTDGIIQAFFVIHQHGAAIFTIDGARIWDSRGNLTIRAATAVDLDGDGREEVIFGCTDRADINNQKALLCAYSSTGQKMWESSLPKNLRYASEYTIGFLESEKHSKGCITVIRVGGEYCKYDVNGHLLEEGTWPGQGLGPIEHDYCCMGSMPDYLFGVNDDAAVSGSYVVMSSDGKVVQSIKGLRRAHAWLYAVMLCTTAQRADYIAFTAGFMIQNEFAGADQAWSDVYIAEISTGRVLWHLHLPAVCYDLAAFHGKDGNAHLLLSTAGEIIEYEVAIRSKQTGTSK